MSITGNVLNRVWPANLRWLFRPFLVVWLFYFLARLVFVALYWKNFNQLNGLDWLHFLQLSIRYDVSTLFSINLLFLVVLLLPLRLPALGFTLIRWVFVFGNWLFLVINAADVPFYAFNSRRTSFDALRILLPEFQAQFTQFVVHYWPVVLAAALMGWLLNRSFGKPPTQDKPVIWSSTLVLLVWVGLSVLLIRNSFKLKPLLPGEAFTLSQTEAGHGILNTPFLLFKTMELTPLMYEPWLGASELNAEMGEAKTENSQPNNPLKGHNLVFILLESFGTEYTGLEGNTDSYTPFLDSLAKEGLYFPHHFSNGRTSRDALPSVLASIPSWMEEAFVSSQFVSIKIDGLGHRLSRSGYKTAFYHGGKNGTMAFDVFSKQAGFQKYMGLNEYPSTSDYDGHWGIFDEPFLQFIAKDLNETQQPFAATVFTLSSHQPYTIPEKYTGQFKKGPLPVHEAVSYTDFALRQFFKQAQLMDWYANTLFVFTADHTQASANPRYQNQMGQFDVPLIFFHPRQKLHADTSQWVQHLDIAPSITDLLQLKVKSVNLLGESVFGKKRQFPIQYQDRMYYRFIPENILGWKGENPESGWMSADQKQPSANEKKAFVADIQYYRRGLVKDSLFLPAP